MSYVSWLRRTALIWAIEAVVLFLLCRLAPGLSIDRWQSALALIVIISLLDAVLWPILSYVALPFMVLSLGVVTLVLNGCILWLAAALVPGISIDGVWTYLLLI